MTTTAELISEAKRHLQSFQREPMNKLDGAVTASATTVTLSYDLGPIQAGAHLQVGLELMYVWSVNVSTKVATVERAQLGSTATVHDSGALVTVNPKFPDFAILKAINDDLLDLSSPMNGLYMVKTVQLTAQTNAASYNLTGATNVLEIVGVRHRTPGQQLNWSTIANYELTQSAGTDYASGYALDIHDGLLSGYPIHVTYKAGFSPLVNLTDDVETVTGLPARMHDIPPLGAAVRLVMPREIARNQTESQGDSRRAEEVPPGAVANSTRGLAGWRAQRIAAEASLLAQQFPDRGFVPQGYGW